MSKTFLKELLMFSLPLCKCCKLLTRIISEYIHIHIYICLKRQNSWFESWTLWEHTAGCSFSLGLWLWGHQ